jgi:hypothetical protein
LLQQHDERLVLLVDQIDAPDHFCTQDAEDGWAMHGNERIRLLNPDRLADELQARLKGESMDNPDDASE